MGSDALKQANEDYERIEKSIKFLETNFPSQPGLKEIAGHIGLSEYHFQRLFSRWVGISPKRFLQFLTKEYAKKLLDDAANILDVAYQAGLTGPSRLHDLFVTCEGVTPGEFKTKGQDLCISYGFHPSPFGRCLLARTERGICGLYFINNGDQRDVFTEFQQYWQKATLSEDPAVTAPLISQIFNPSLGKNKEPLHLILKGTNFQIKVWEALTRIPFGMAVTYEDVAVQVGIPKATRAVGTAVGHNPISYIIPCHRVIRKTAEFGNYGSGPARKKAILGWEAARANLHP
jgi:AraC family transcriptional regulator of adaptative response/methylated-DNA-[protein]-cysteine methyltransferase